MLTPFALLAVFLAALPETAEPSPFKRLTERLLDAEGVTGSNDATSSSSTGDATAAPASIWDWWFDFQNSSYFLPVIVIGGVLILGLCCVAYVVYRRRNAAQDLEIGSFAASKGASKAAEKCGCAGAKGGNEKCGCAGAKGGADKCGCAGAKAVSPPSGTGIELYANRALTASTAIDNSVRIVPAVQIATVADHNAAIHAIV